jgi:hypothetical protein
MPDIGCYLPDEIYAEAKEAKLPFSQLLRNAVTRELDRRKAVADTLAAQSVWTERFADESNREYNGRITGTLLVEGAKTTAYLLPNENILVARTDEPGRPYRWGDVQAEMDFQTWLEGFGFTESEVIEIGEAMGEEMTIDIN